MIARPQQQHRQSGASAIEFALVAVILLTLLFGIIEFGRLFFTLNSVQEITRRAAREQVVRWVSAADQVQRLAVLRAGSSGEVNFPGSPDIRNVHVRLSFLNPSMAVIPANSLPASPTENFNNCFLPADEDDYAKCIKFVQAALSKDAGGTEPLDFSVIAPYMPRDAFALPVSTVTMPAEAMGLL